MTPFIIGVVAFAIVLAAAESLHRGAGVRSEDTRRLAHVGSALVAVVLPLALGWWSIVALGALFTALMAFVEVARHVAGSPRRRPIDLG